MSFIIVTLILAAWGARDFAKTVTTNTQTMGKDVREEIRCASIGKSQREARRIFRAYGRW